MSLNLDYMSHKATLKIHREDNFILLELGGFLDTTAAPSVFEQINNILTENLNKVIVDLKNLEYVSSAGLKVFLQASEIVRKQGQQIALCQANPAIQQIFEISGLNGIIQHYNTQEEARASLENIRSV